MLCAVQQTARVTRPYLSPSYLCAGAITHLCVSLSDPADLAQNSVAANAMQKLSQGNPAFVDVLFAAGILLVFFSRYAKRGQLP